MDIDPYYLPMLRRPLLWKTLTSKCCKKNWRLPKRHLHGSERMQWLMLLKEISARREYSQSNIAVLTWQKRRYVSAQKQPALNDFQSSAVIWHRMCFSIWLQWSKRTVKIRKWRFATHE